MTNLTIMTAIATSLLIGNVVASQEVPDDLLSGPTLETEEVTSEQMIDRRMQEVGSKTTLGTRVKVGLWLKAMESMDLDLRQKNIAKKHIKT